jgi:hypothetical protein
MQSTVGVTTNLYDSRCSTDAIFWICNMDNEFNQYQQTATNYSTTPQRLHPIAVQLSNETLFKKMGVRPVEFYMI